MVRTDCHQILLLNFRSSTETVSRQDSQIDFAGLHKNVSQILATIDFSSGEIAGKSLSVRKNFIGDINLGQTSF